MSRSLFLAAAVAAAGLTACDDGVDAEPRARAAERTEPVDDADTPLVDDDDAFEGETDAPRRAVPIPWIDAEVRDR